MAPTMPKAKTEKCAELETGTPRFTLNDFLSGYEVARDGKVFSVAHNWRGYGKRELQQSPNADGYPSVRLTLRGVRVRISVHRLVAAVYLPPRPSAAHEIRHLDGNKLRSVVDNLAWGTRADNAADRTAHGRAAPITPAKRARMVAGLRRWRERNVGA